MHIQCSYTFTTYIPSHPTAACLLQCAMCPSVVQPHVLSWMLPLTMQLEEVLGAPASNKAGNWRRESSSKQMSALNPNK